MGKTYRQTWLIFPQGGKNVPRHAYHMGAKNNPENERGPFNVLGANQLDWLPTE